ncbi:MAG: hypothetical protein COB15_16545 [Flavobacteriales bacterium]|nr:MAG: hypothetical protein COB15_16545 [Flavobacteriales bacterium]
MSLSVFFWLLNALSKTSTTEAVFNVSYINPPENKVVLNELPTQLKIKVKGLGFDLMAYKLRLRRSTINIDLLSQLQGLDNKIQRVTLASSSFSDYIASQLGDQIEVKAIYPDSIRFLFDVRVEKKVKIITNTQLNFKKQIQLFGKLLVKPAITNVSGPASILDTLTAVYTEELVLNDLSETTTESVGFRAEYALKKLTFNPEKVIIHIPVEKFTESSVMVKILAVNVPDSIEIKAIPNEVEIKFLLPLSKMASLQSANFSAKIDYDQINDNFNHKLKVELTEYPEYIQSLTLNPGKVEYILKKRK